MKQIDLIEERLASIKDFLLVSPETGTPFYDILDKRVALTQEINHGTVTALPIQVGVGKSRTAIRYLVYLAIKEYFHQEVTKEIKLHRFFSLDNKLVNEEYSSAIDLVNELWAKHYLSEDESVSIQSRIAFLENKALRGEKVADNIEHILECLGESVDGGKGFKKTRAAQILSEARILETERSLITRSDAELRRRQEETYKKNAEKLYDSVRNLISIKHQFQEGFKPQFLNLVRDDFIFKSIFADCLVTNRRLLLVFATIDKSLMHSRPLFSVSHSLMDGTEASPFSGVLMIDESDKASMRIDERIFSSLLATDNIASIHLKFSEIKDDIYNLLPAEIATPKIVEKLQGIKSACVDFNARKLTHFPLVFSSDAPVGSFITNMNDTHIYNTNIKECRVEIDSENKRTIVKSSRNKSAGDENFIQYITDVENQLVFNIIREIKNCINIIRKLKINGKCKYENWGNYDIVQLLLTHLIVIDNNSFYEKITALLAVDVSSFTSRNFTSIPYESTIAHFEFQSSVDEADDDDDIARFINLSQSKGCAETTILKCAEKATVFLISATSENKSCVNNLDYKYISSQLPPRAFAMLTGDEIQQNRSVYEAKRMYAENNINIDVRAVDVDASYTTADDIRKGLLISERRDEADRNNKSGASERFYKKREDKLKVALKDLFDDYYTQIDGGLKKVQSSGFLIFLNASIKGQSERAKYTKLAEQAAKQCNRDKAPKPRVVFLYADTLKDYTPFLSNPDEPVVIFTTGASAGAGTNLTMMLPEEGSEYVNVDGTGLSSDYCDYDGVYVEMPTKQVFSKTDDDDNTNESKSEQLLSCYKLQVLKYNNILTKNVVDFQQHKAVNNNSSGDFAAIKQSPVFLFALEKNAEQMVGRLSRTPNKLRNIKIILDIELFKYFQFSKILEDERQQHFVSHEFRAVLEIAREVGSVEYTKIEEKQRIADETVRINKYAEQSNYISRLVRNLFSSKKTDRLQGYIDKYVFLREMLLENPTISNSDLRLLEESSENDLFYDVFINNPKHTNYLSVFNEKLTDKQRKDLGKYKQRHAYVCRFDTIQMQQSDVNVKYQEFKISEHSTLLSFFMQNETIRSFFEANNYATSFDETDNIISPAFRKTYVGMLGEKAFEAIFNTHSQQKLEELLDNDFEVVDYVFKDVAIDVKTWGLAMSSNVSLNELINKGYQKKAKLGVDKMLFVNMLPQEEHHQRTTCDKTGTVMVSSSFLNLDGSVNIDRFRKILDFIAP